MYLICRKIYASRQCNVVRLFTSVFKHIRIKGSRIRSLLCKTVSWGPNICKTCANKGGEYWWIHAWGNYLPLHYGHDKYSYHNADGYQQHLEDGKDASHNMYGKGKHGLESPSANRARPRKKNKSKLYIT